MGGIRKKKRGVRVQKSTTLAAAANPDAIAKMGSKEKSESKKEKKRKRS
jgi:hypothetical protein